MTTLFISDLHLCAARPEINRAFFDFLDREARRADALYILGDLFEYWAGDDDMGEAFNAQVCGALARFATQEIATYFIRGNRDFLIGEEFAVATGITLLEEPLSVAIAGQPTLLLHGDVMCTDDLAYQQFRRQVRDAQWQRQFLALPLAARKRKIEEVRQLSESAKQSKAAEIMDVNADAVAETFRRNGYVRMIHGHTHRPAQHWHDVDGQRCERWVLADWYERGSYLACDESGCRSIALA